MFDKARWNQLLAGTGGARSARASLEYLCHTYRRPVLVFIRHKGYPSDEAEAIAHAFFATLLKGGVDWAADPDRARFRRVLLAALHRYLSANPTPPRTSRAPNAAPDSSTMSGEFFDPRLNSAQHFDRAWALALLERAMLGLAREAGANGHAVEFETLKGFLVENPRPGDYDRMTEDSGLRASVLRTALDRLRRRLDVLVREALSETLDDPSEVEDELDILRAALGGASVPEAAYNG